MPDGDVYVLRSSAQPGCTNKLKLRRENLERELFEVMCSSLRKARHFDQMFTGLSSAIRFAQESERKELAILATKRGSVEAEIVQLTQQSENLALAMAQHSYSKAFSKLLREQEARKEVLMTQLKRDRKPVVEITDEEVREYLSHALEHLAEILRADPVKSREEIRQRVECLVLDPMVFENSPAYRIRGDVRPFGGKEPMMLSCNG